MQSVKNGDANCTLKSFKDFPTKLKKCQENSGVVPLVIKTYSWKSMNIAHHRCHRYLMMNYWLNIVIACYFHSYVKKITTLPRPGWQEMKHESPNSRARHWKYHERPMDPHKWSLSACICNWRILNNSNTCNTFDHLWFVAVSCCFQFQRMAMPNEMIAWGLASISCVISPLSNDQNLETSFDEDYELIHSLMNITIIHRFMERFIHLFIHSGTRNNRIGARSFGFCEA